MAVYYNLYDRSGKAMIEYSRGVCFASIRGWFYDNKPGLTFNVVIGNDPQKRANEFYYILKRSIVSEFFPDTYDQFRDEGTRKFSPKEIPWPILVNALSFARLFTAEENGKYLPAVLSLKDAFPDIGPNTALLLGSHFHVKGHTVTTHSFNGHFFLPSYNIRPGIMKKWMLQDNWQASILKDKRFSVGDRDSWKSNFYGREKLFRPDGSDWEAVAEEARKQLVLEYGKRAMASVSVFNRHRSEISITFKVLELIVNKMTEEEACLSQHKESELPESVWTSGK